MLWTLVIQVFLPRGLSYKVHSHANEVGVGTPLPAFCTNASTSCEEALMELTCVSTWEALRQQEVRLGVGRMGRRLWGSSSSGA